MSPADTAQAWLQIDRHGPATCSSLERAGAFTGSAAIACAPTPRRTLRRPTDAPCYRALPSHGFVGSRARRTAIVTLGIAKSPSSPTDTSGLGRRSTAGRFWGAR